MIYVSAVPSNEVAKLWPKLFPHLRSAAEYSHGRYEPEDIVESVLSGESQLWIAFEGENIKGITTTKIAHYPRKTCLDMIFLGGEDFFEWKDAMLEVLQRWARDCGCDAIESWGRPGFTRVFKDDGYKMLWQGYELPVAASEVDDG